MNSSGFIRLDSPVVRQWNHAPSRPTLLLVCDTDGSRVTLRRSDRIVRTWDDPTAALRWMAAFEVDDAPADAQWIGYLSYDLGRLFEPLAIRPKEDLGLPLFVFGLHSRHGPAESPARTTAHPCAGRPLDSNFTKQAYLSAVERVIEFIGAGDVFQVNLSQRFSAGLPAQPGEIYERLQRRSPAWYGACLDYGDHALICNSPELFLRITPRADGSRHVLTRPIKGTRRRGPGMELALRDSIKDQAELNMIVDLERNDLGRICEIGSVKVIQPRMIEAHPTVYHGAAAVEGILRPRVDFVDLLRATFPGGSITGAPKIRAMQIIEELEPARRGPYCGAIGSLSADGRIEFNIAIRTMIVKEGLVHIPVGGGIVADSDPAAEYEETLVKAKALFAALGIQE